MGELLHIRVGGPKLHFGQPPCCPHLVACKPGKVTTCAGWLSTKSLFVGPMCD